MIDLRGSPLVRASSEYSSIENAAGRLHAVLEGREALSGTHEPFLANNAEQQFRRLYHDLFIQRDRASAMPQTCKKYREASNLFNLRGLF